MPILQWICELDDDINDMEPKHIWLFVSIYAVVTFVSFGIIVPFLIGLCRMAWAFATTSYVQ